MKEFLVTFTGPRGSSFQQMILADDMDSAMDCVCLMYPGGYFDYHVEEAPNYAGQEAIDPPWSV